MGSIYKISCNCGYEKELNLGGGLASCNINVVNRMFSEEKLEGFNRYYKNKEVQSFSVENELSLCDKCKEIMTVAVLKAQLTNNKKLTIINGCHICGNTEDILNELVTCPKCGQEMIREDIGNWD